MGLSPAPLQEGGEFYEAPGADAGGGEYLDGDGYYGDGYTGADDWEPAVAPPAPEPAKGSWWGGRSKGQKKHAPAAEAEVDLD